MKKHFLFIAIFIGGFVACTNAQKSSNPAAQGFNAAGSDAKAIALADAAMDAMGGRKNWDNTRYITWNFFGNRRLTWDKWTGDARVENLKNDQTVLLNVNTDKGRVMKNGREITQPDSVAKYVKQAKSAWINDSYWLLMPYKLKDSGVTLKYMGEETTEDGAAAEKIQMTFENVGDTPQNKYYVWLSPDTKMVTQWAYYPKADMDKPGFVLPWKNYKPYGKVMISGDRGQRQLTDIQVFDKLPKSVFESFDKVTF